MNNVEFENNQTYIDIDENIYNHRKKFEIYGLKISNISELVIFDDNFYIDYNYLKLTLKINDFICPIITSIKNNIKEIPIQYYYKDSNMLLYDYLNNLHTNTITIKNGNDAASIYNLVFDNLLSGTNDTTIINTIQTCLLPYNSTDKEFSIEFYKSKVSPYFDSQSSDCTLIIIFSIEKTDIFLTSRGNNSIIEKDLYLNYSEEGDVKISNYDLYNNNIINIYQIPVIIDLSNENINMCDIHVKRDTKFKIQCTIQYCYPIIYKNMFYISIENIKEISNKIKKTYIPLLKISPNKLSKNPCIYLTQENIIVQENELNNIKKKDNVIRKNELLTTYYF
jgi:hypothetical protein